MGDPINSNLLILQKVVLGDSGAFREIYSHYRGKLYQYAYALTKSEETADEITQEVFVKIWQKREQINTELNFEAYLKKITLNHVLNFLKKAARDKELQARIYHNVEQIRNSTEEQLLEKELMKTYTAAIEKLSPQKKLIYQLHYNEELTHEEISQKLNISKSTVNNHMVEAVKFIRNYVRSHAEVTCLLIAIIHSFKNR
jgi:RNA polymerase sigma-70 factor (ECF subfamily)